jgi:hypothetical protein
MLPLRLVFTLLTTVAPAAVPSARQIDGMIREADAIWSPYGVQVSLARSPELRPDAVRLTLEFAPSSAQAPRLGAIWIVDGVPQDRVVLASREVGALVDATLVRGRRLDQWPPAVIDDVHGRALGRVLAHELGHYLLAFAGHTGEGLMKRAFRGRDLSAADRRPFRLDPLYLPRLNARLARLLPAPAVVAASMAPP